ncbi:glycoside hydrolase family 5 protein [Halobacteria archaeon AArc-m2/3/4]|uniref:Glycoside hydrolase family 5 protein n=1 Tax=Natronoglomus mannanivorans TaxID=2979990 RepID=A0ABT2QCT5_9EURY|nr:glycoside hydrolase family 5 protein [Halobacteria archaeon AArc-m2/3/4]
MRATAGAGVAALGLGAGVSGSAVGQASGVGNLSEFQELSVSSDNRIVNEDGETFVMRGVNIPDPKRLERTKHLRGKSGEQLLDMVTSNESGWYPRVVRVPAQPQDIGEHPMGHTGPEYEPGELESPDVVADDRRKMRPSQPVAFTEDQLQDYLENYYDPIVERCAERGVYCIVDFHRHWHEQPPGDPSLSDAAAENHLPYNSPYTNYWARNTYSGSQVEFTEDDPGSWGHVDQAWIDAHGYGQTQGDTPYNYEYWQVNEELLEEAIMFWEAAAERYGDMDHVIFEPYNEPTSPGIWGPVEGCGADKQHGLWRTFQDDFMGPILDTIRQYYDGLLLVGVPGWCQSLQGLHWRDFNQAGYDNIAVTWHNYAGHDVSQMHNWFNDTNYQSPDGVEADTGQSLDDPYLEPPNSVDDPDCWGWEGYEAAGLQEAMDHHPVAVTEFGWVDNTDVAHWLRGSTTGLGTTNEYGIPFFDALEEDDRISWVAWVADVRWHPTMFEYPDGPNEGDVADSLENQNFYDPDFEDLPAPCPDLPCEWEILDGEDSGAYIKDRLEVYADDSVPMGLDLVTDDGSNDDSGGNGGNGTPGEPQDTTGDGLYNDITGSGSTTTSDVTEFFDGFTDEYSDPEYFDFTGNGEVTTSDVVELFESI